MSGLLDLRKRFPILDRVAYLVSHSMGAMPEDAAEELRGMTAAWAHSGVGVWEEGWWDLPVTVGDELAPLIGAQAGSVAMLPNVTLAEGVVASCIRWEGARRRVVVSELDFPSVHYLWHGVPGAEVVTVASEDGLRVDAEAVIDSLDERTALVAISHVLFKSGFIVDVEPIVEAAHRMGAMVVLDCYHSAGVVPFSVERLGADMAVGGSVKWLCGGPGAGWLYVRPGLHERLEPWLAGWQADDEPFAFRPGPLRPARGIRRFLNGTPPVAGLVAARAGYRVVAEAGVEAIRERSLELTGAVIDLADELEIPVVSERDPGRRGGTVTLGVHDEERKAAALVAEGVVVDSRPGAGIRIGPHFYNSEEDLGRLREALARLVGARAG